MDNQFILHALWVMIDFFFEYNLVCQSFFDVWPYRLIYAILVNSTDKSLLISLYHHYEL